MNMYDYGYKIDFERNVCYYKYKSMVTIYACY